MASTVDLEIKTQLGLWNCVGSQATCAGPCERQETLEPFFCVQGLLPWSYQALNPGMISLGALEDGSPWQLTRWTESSPRGWVIQLSISQSILGWMNWHITTALNFCFLLSVVRGHVPGSLGPQLGGVNTLGLVTDNYSTVPPWLSRDKTLFAFRQAHLWEKLSG